MFDNTARRRLTNSDPLRLQMHETDRSCAAATNSIPQRAWSESAFSQPCPKYPGPVVRWHRPQTEYLELFRVFTFSQPGHSSTVASY